MSKSFSQGIYSIDYDTYRAAEGISNSDLSLVSKTLASYKWKKDAIARGDYAEEDTEAKFLGKIIHPMILEPEKKAFEKLAIKPEGMKFNTKDGKDWLSAHKNKEIVTKEQHNMLKGMRNSLLSHPRAVLYISRGLAEQSIFVKDEETGLTLKGRPDYLPSGSSNLVTDLKSALDASRDGFSKAIGRYKYFRQGAFYLDLCNMLGTISKREIFAIIAIEKKPPYATNIFIVPNDAIEAGRREYRSLLNKLSDAIQKNSFPSFESEEIIPSIPEYYLK